MHNLVFGEMYLDLGETMYVRNLRTREYATLVFTRRGWTSGENSSYLLDGKVFSAAPLEQNKKDITPDQFFPAKGGVPKYAIFGNWNKAISVVQTDPKGKHLSAPEVVWQKNEYPENWQWMYGLTHYAINLNYFPSRMHDVVPPTDTRWRPDQRVYENGEMEAAAERKDFLEVK